MIKDDWKYTNSPLKWCTPVHTNCIWSELKFVANLSWHLLIFGRNNTRGFRHRSHCTPRISFTQQCCGGAFSFFSHWMLQSVLEITISYFSVEKLARMRYFALFPRSFFQNGIKSWLNLYININIKGKIRQQNVDFICLERPIEEAWHFVWFFFIKSINSFVYYCISIHLKQTTFQSLPKYHINYKVNILLEILSDFRAPKSAIFSALPL